MAFALIVVRMTFAGSLCAADDEGDAPEASVRQRTTAAGIHRFRPGAWGVVGVEIVNHRQTSADVVSGLYADGAPMNQFSRRVRIPAESVRRAWIPFRPATQVEGDLSARYFLRNADDASGALLRGSKERFMEAELLPETDAPVTVLIDDWDADVSQFTIAAQEFTAATRLAIGATRTFLEIPADKVPAFELGLEAVDHVVLAGNGIADSPAGLSTLRTWVHQGGRLLILLDQVDMRTVQRLLGDDVPITEVDRVRLLEVTLTNRLKGTPSGETRVSEVPVDLVRVLTSNVDVIHEIDGWPASFRKDVGRGRVVVTTLSPEAWIRPRLPGEQKEDLEYNSYFVARKGLDEVADYLTRPLDPSPLTAEDFESFLAEQVGYRIPSRGTVTSVVGLFWVGLLGVGVWLLRTHRLERLALFGPLLACLAAVPLVVAGNRSRNTVPPTAAVAEMVHADPGTGTVNSQGVAALYVPEPTPAAIAAGDGRMLTPRRGRMEGAVQQRLWTDLEEWHWEHLTLPTGLHFADTQQHASSAQPLRATATFGPEGLQGQLHTGAYADPTDLLIASATQHTLAVSLESDGRFAAGRDDLLDVGAYSSSPLLTDEQRRRQAVYQKLLRPRQESRYPRRPMLLAWTRPTGQTLTFPDSMESVQTALLAIPLELQPPPPGTDVFIPSPLVMFEPVTNADGSQTTAYDPRRGEWRPLSQGATFALRFQVPRATLPLTLRQATLSLALRAPKRNVTVATGSEAKPVPLTILEDAVGHYEFEIDRIEGLRLDDEGGLHVQLDIGDLIGQDEADAGLSGIDQTWAIEFIRLELTGRTADSKSNPSE